MCESTARCLSVRWCPSSSWIAIRWYRWPTRGSAAWRRRGYLWASRRPARRSRGRARRRPSRTSGASSRRPPHPPPQSRAPPRCRATPSPLRRCPRRRDAPSEGRSTARTRRRNPGINGPSALPQRWTHPSRRPVHLQREPSRCRRGILSIYRRGTLPCRQCHFSRASCTMSLSGVAPARLGGECADRAYTRQHSLVAP